jgi:hypothetical protein
LRTILTISALFITIIHILFRLPFVLFLRFVVEFRIAGLFSLPRPNSGGSIPNHRVVYTRNE